MLCQPVHPESSISHFHQFSVLGSAIWFFIKTRCGLRNKNLEIIFAPSLWSFAVSRPNLLNLYLTNFGACSANLCTQNQILAIFTNFLCWIVLFAFLLKLAVELETRISNKFLHLPYGLLQSADQIC